MCIVTCTQRIWVNKLLGSGRQLLQGMVECGGIADKGIHSNWGWAAKSCFATGQSKTPSFMFPCLMSVSCVRNKRSKISQVRGRCSTKQAGVAGRNYSCCLELTPWCKVLEKVHWGANLQAVEVGTCLICCKKWHQWGENLPHLCQK